MGFTLYSAASTAIAAGSWAASCRVSTRRRSVLLLCAVLLICSVLLLCSTTLLICVASASDADAAEVTV
jgi:hypothetical protein